MAAVALLPTQRISCCALLPRPCCPGCAEWFFNGMLSLVLKPASTTHLVIERVCCVVCCVLPCMQELSQRAKFNSKLQSGIRDSFEALGAYMRGMPSLHHAHRKQQGLHKGAPCMGQVR